MRKIRKLASRFSRSLRRTSPNTCNDDADADDAFLTLLDFCVSDCDVGQLGLSDCSPLADCGGGGGGGGGGSGSDDGVVLEPASMPS